MLQKIVDRAMFLYIFYEKFDSVAYHCCRNIVDPGSFVEWLHYLLLLYKRVIQANFFIYLMEFMAFFVTVSAVQLTVYFSKYFGKSFAA